MNPSITRWKIEPSHNGPEVVPLAVGCVYSLLPWTRPTKFATVLGAWSGKRIRWMSPWLVCSVAFNAPPTRDSLLSVTSSSCHLRQDPLGRGTIGSKQRSKFKTNDEVKAMTRAADSAGESVKSGLLDLRKRAVWVGKGGAEAGAE